MAESENYKKGTEIRSKLMGEDYRRQDEQDGLRRPDDAEVRRLRPRGGVRHAVVAPRPRPQDARR